MTNTAFLKYLATFLVGGGVGGGLVYLYDRRDPAPAEEKPKKKDKNVVAMKSEDMEANDKDKHDYAAQAARYNSTKATEAAESESPKEPNGYSVKPYVIDEDEWLTNGGYKKIRANYYNIDDTLADEMTDAVLEDPDKLLGEDFRDHFGDRSGDPEMVYIRNESITTDYEVTLREGSYAENVLGVYSIHGVPGGDS